MPKENSASFDLYKDRKIANHNLVTEGEWKIKIYTISIHQEFKNHKVLEHCINSIPLFLENPNSSTFQTYKIAYMIVHEARDGFWVLFSWWTGGEMIETKVYFSEGESDNIQASPYGNGFICIWELEIVLHERKAWIEHVLKLPKNPNFLKYLEDTFQK